MKTDISKLSFDEMKHYLGVFLQMGRVQLDSDWNEQSELWFRLLQRHAADAVDTGSPNHGFRVDDRILLDALDARAGWEAVAGTTPQLYVDYLDHRTGEGALHVEGAAALVRTFDTPLDLEGLNEVVFAAKGTFALNQCRFFLGAGGNRFNLSVSEDADQVEGWRIFRADPGALPPAFPFDAVEEYGFRNLDAARTYLFDFLKVDLPIRRLLVPAARVQPFTATPLNPGDVPRLAIDDDHRRWRSTVLAVEDAGSVRYEFPALQDLSAVRRIRFAARSPTAGANVTLRLVDADGATADLGPHALPVADDWTEVSENPPGGIDLGRVEAVEWRGLDATEYLLSPVVVDMELDGNLVIQGGDGTSEGAGRFYGDGLAAVKERHDTYSSQADLPAADPDVLLPPSAGHCRIDLAYLDLWERPITYIEDPEIREVALEGPDTCTRTRLVAQVRILRGQEAALGTEPAAPWDDFDALPRCGRGTLTTKDQPDAVLDPCADPCEPEIEGTFVGEENRLYRVEIHTCGNVGAAGAAGTATFKWSAENGAVASPLITRAEPGALSARVEKPELFREGDLIEICDDLVDLVTGPYEDRVNHRCHQRGELRRITGVNLDDQRVSWEDDGLGFHAPLAHDYTLAYHARVRRWNDVLPATPGDIVLADGVVIELGGSDMVPGDYWVFTTRVVDRSVERLIEEPPRGICHRYFKLATLTRCNVGGTTSLVVDDCRPTFNPLTGLEATDVAFDPGRCALHDASWAEVENVQEAIEKLCGQHAGGLCSATVGDGVISFGDFTSIRAAIDSLDGHGGVVCVLRGNHLVEESVEVPSNVIVRGAGAATRIAFVPRTEGDALFRLESGAQRVRFEDFFAVTELGSSLVHVNEAEHVTIRGCTLANLRIRPLEAFLAEDGEEPDTAVKIAEVVRDLTIDDCGLLASAAVSGHTVAGCRLLRTVLRSTFVGLFSRNFERLRVAQCDLGGIGASLLGQLEGQEVGRDTLGAAQDVVQAVLDEQDQLVLAGYVARYAGQVTFADTRVTAILGLLPLVGSLHAVERCSFLGLVNVTLPFSFLTTVEDCVLIGLFNVVQAGIGFGLDFHANRMLGLYGLTIAAPGELLDGVLGLLGAIVEDNEEVPSELYVNYDPAIGSQAVNREMGTVEGSLSFGFAALLTARDNLFLSYHTGIHKDEFTLTADVAVAGNRFYLCTKYGVHLAQGFSYFRSFGNDLAPGHDVHHNHFNVEGVGVRSEVQGTVVQDNRISAGGEAAIQLHGDSSKACGNTLVPSDSGTVSGDGIQVGEFRAGIVVGANRIHGSLGHGILIQGQMSNLVIQDNDIAWMGGNGITVSGATVNTNLLIVRGNRIAHCVTSDAAFWKRGAIVLGDGSQITIADNQVTQNGRNLKEAVHGIYAEDVDNLVVNGNQVWDNGGPEENPKTLQGSGVTLVRAGRDVQILGNGLLRNSGYGLRIMESSLTVLFNPNILTGVFFRDSGSGSRDSSAAAENILVTDSKYNTGWNVAVSYLAYYVDFADEVYQSVTVANNTITGTFVPALVDVADVDRLIFNDNRMKATGTETGVPPVRISANHLIFTGNHVEAPVGEAGSVRIVSLGAAPRIVQSNNILSGGPGQLLPASAFQVVNANNLFYF